VSAKPTLTYLGLALAVIAWGASFVAARMVLAGDGHTLTPIGLAAVRFALASVLLLPVAGWRMLREGWPCLRDLIWLCLLGQLGFSTYFWLQYTGVQRTNAGISAVLVVGLMPSATAVVSRFTLREEFGWWRAAGLALGALGVLAVSLQRDLRVSTESGFLVGVACLVANAFAIAIYSTAVRRLRSRNSTVTVTALTMTFGALGLLPLAIIEQGWDNLGYLDTAQYGAIAFLVIGCSMFAYFAYNYALAHMPAYRVVTWVYLEPVVAVVLGFTLLQEQVSLYTIIGSVLIASSVYLVQHRNEQ